LEISPPKANIWNLTPKANIVVLRIIIEYGSFKGFCSQQTN
jgi:hypothetical protein